MVQAVFVSALLAMLTYSAQAHVEVYPKVAKSLEYSMWYFRVHTCYEEEVSYPIEKLEAHIPKELVESYAVPGYLAGWPTTVEKKDDGGAIITWTYVGAEDLPNEFGIDFPVLLYIPEQGDMTEFAMDTYVTCRGPDGEIVNEQLGEEATKIEYGSVDCPASCGEHAGGYGDEHEDDHEE